jgi:hypothetical protein
MANGDVEVEGVSFGVFGKSIKFQGDFWDEPQFVPTSQCDIEELPSDEGQSRCRLYIRRWLAKKNGWG